MQWCPRSLKNGVTIRLSRHVLINKIQSGARRTFSQHANEKQVCETSWKLPKGQTLHSSLRINNSLSKSKEIFITPNGKTISWYVCGPTVYDAAHLGHARNYISCDVIRRILSDYFQYDITYVMNVTDVDDKIILRSREAKITVPELSRKWEQEFFADMQKLNVLPPTVVTRVSEFVPEIISFVQNLVDKNLAYEQNGSVYFNTAAFAAKHKYPKLGTGSVQHITKLIEEGEGALTEAGLEKLNPTDFVLWKKSKDSDMDCKWPSPWGEGRPGWHIECSAMASSLFGNNIDIHSGGEDLKFPHHDNELAQSEAYYDTCQWVNYFMHCGHLHIEGRKMSKSLKNFITIQECLKDFTPRQLRLLCLMHNYDNVMEYNRSLMIECVHTEKIFTEFFQNVFVLWRKNGFYHSASSKWLPKEQALNKSIREASMNIHDALCDNFDTTQSIQALLQLIRQVNTYSQQGNINNYLLYDAAHLVGRILKVFGLSENSIGLESQAHKKDDILYGVLDALTAFRAQVRNSAIKKEPYEKILKSADEVRNVTLPSLGVRLGDNKDGTSVWKLDDKETLLKQIQLHKEHEEHKAKMKQLNEEKEMERKRKSQIPADKYFMMQSDKFSKFDENGFPTADIKGEPLSKSLTKKLHKELEQHRAFLANYHAKDSKHVEVEHSQD